MQRTITVLGDIKDLSELLQGASLDQVKLSPGGGRLRLELELTRACPELQPAGRGGFGFGRQVPQVKSRLALGQIREASVQRLDDGSPGRLSLLACDAVSGGYVLSVTSHDGLKLALTLDQLDGDFRDVGKPLV
ncbi:MAG: hypothetical protein HY598_04095 [Candidatus Omnitrophica bacterium]|nr:hypothetical protein [Candidatus Omnitrophota bacterium]